MLKADMHMHAKEDEQDFIQYTAQEAVDKAVSNGFDILSFTFHDKFFYDGIKEYAEKKGILLIPGIEKQIEGKHVLLYNFKPEELEQIRHFEDLKLFKKKNNLVIAPHPFYKKSVCMGRKLKKYKELFDGIEMCYFYNHIINFNKKAIKFARKHKKPVIATSDLHLMENFGTNYTLIDSEKDINSVITAIKEGRVMVKTKPLTLFEMAKTLIKHMVHDVKNESSRN